MRGSAAVRRSLEEGDVKPMARVVMRISVVRRRMGGKRRGRGCIFEGVKGGGRDWSELWRWIR